MLHGCRKSVLSEVWFIPITDEIPVVNLYLTDIVPDKGADGAKTSRYDPHVLGYRRATKTFTK